LGIPSYQILMLKPFIERLHITFTVIHAPDRATRPLQ
jgi:hypothetical protein